VVLALADPGEGMECWHTMLASQARQATRQRLGPRAWGGWTLLLAGDLVEAERWTAMAREEEHLAGVRTHHALAWTAHAQAERGHVDAAAASLAANPPAREMADAMMFERVARAELALAAGDHERAITLSEQLETMRPPDVHPVWMPWRGLRARALSALGHRAAARALAAEELDLARRSGAPWVIGRGLRLLGETEGAAGVPHLREAVELVAGSSARLEHAKALAALGDALAAAGDPGEAAVHRAAALPLARACGADALAARLDPGTGSRDAAACVPAG
jgi:tetratricopeptide (TPR) repeat protein